MSSGEGDPRMANLPRWAQDKMQQDRRRIAHMEQMLAQHDGTAHSRISFTRPGEMETGHIPDGCRVAFDVRDHAQSPTTEDVRIQCRIDGGLLRVTGDVPLRIMPISSNAVEIGLEVRP